MKLRDTIGQTIFNIARACAPAFEGQQKSFVFAMIFAVSCFASAAAPAKTNPKIEKARQSVVSKNALAQADIRRDITTETDPAVRAKLVSLLAHTDMDQSSLSEIRARLADSDPAVRSEALIALAQNRGKSAAPELRSALQSDPSAGVRLAAAFWLGGLKDAGSIPALSKALAADQDPHVRAQAAHSLKWIGSTASRNELRKGRGDKDVRVRKIANE